MRDGIVLQLRSLPQVDAIISRSDVRSLDAPRWAIIQAIREEIDTLRARILAGKPVEQGPDGKVSIKLEALEHRVRGFLAPSLTRIINATGVVLHTNLGRAPLAQAAIDRILDIARGYGNLEYDIANAKRGSRDSHLARLVCQLVHAEDAVVVNNNAGAVMLCLAALSAGKEAVVSRGELVEIGGSFRIPDVMRLSNTHLVEVGTTNKTRIEDYREAINERTAVLLKIHPSNFAIVGFTEEASLAEVVSLGHERGVATVLDLGSGSLLSSAELSAFGLTTEPSVMDAVATGADLVTFSGDKLIGGPQAGIICGHASGVAAIRSHPLMRALRPDKLTIAALEATLSLYRDDRAQDEVPTWRMLGESQHSVRARAEQTLARLGDHGSRGLIIELTPCESQVGGGTMPLARLPSFGLAVRWSRGSARTLERALHALPMPIIGRITDERVILDLRTVRDSDLDALVRGLATLVRSDDDAGAKSPEPPKATA